LIGVPAVLIASPGHAAELTTPDTGYLLNTFFLLVCGVLVMFMAAGFAMLEAGMVSCKSVAVICIKNIALYSLAGIAFYLAGGLVMMSACRLLETLRLDDVVGAIPVHLAAGAWGTVAVAITNPDASFLIQIFGVLAVGVFVATTTFAVWFALRATVGIRLRRHQELAGGDLTEVGMRAYNFS
jgi:ammonia channel protein AmtB